MHIAGLTSQGVNYFWLHCSPKEERLLVGQTGNRFNYNRTPIIRWLKKNHMSNFWIVEGIRFINLVENLFFHRLKTIPWKSKAANSVG